MDEDHRRSELRRRLALEAAIRRALAASPEERRAMTAAAARYVREYRDARLAGERFAAALRRVVDGAL